MTLKRDPALARVCRVTPAAPHHAQVSLSVPGKLVERPSRRLSCRPRVALPWAFTPSRSCARPGGSAARDAHFGGSSPVAGEKLWVSQSYLGIPKRGSQGPRDQPTAPTSAKHPPLAKPPSPAGACSAPHEGPTPGRAAQATSLSPAPVVPEPPAPMGTWNRHICNHKERLLGPLSVPPCPLRLAWAPTTQRSFLQKATVDFAWKFFDGFRLGAHTPVLVLPSLPQDPQTHDP